MMKSVILLLMILGVGGWVLSHSASYIAHRRAAHGPLTRDFFMETQRYPRHSARPWRRPSSSWITGGTGPPGVRWTPARRTCAGSKSRTVTSCSGLVSFLLETWDASRSAGVCPSCPRAAQLTHFLLAALQVYYRGAPEVTSAGPRCLRADFSPLHGTPEH